MNIPRQFARILFVFLLLSPAGLRAQGEVEALIQKGDVFDRKIEPTAALSFYLPAEKLDPGNVSLLLKIARQYRHEAAEVASVKEKIRLSEIGKNYALRAVALAPKDSEAHLSVAISYAKMASLLGTKEKLAASRNVKIFVDNALALDGGNDLAWHVLGCWYERMVEVGTLKRAAAKLLYGEIPEGSSEQAVVCFKKAIKLDPKRLSYYIELGLAYAHMGKNEEARANLKKGLAMPNIEAGDPECKQRGREALKNFPGR